MAGTISECFGGYCPSSSNPLAAPTPTPTPTPTNSYIPPPSHPTTQFTPAPSCLAEPNMWLFSTGCEIKKDNGEGVTPDWLECSITEFGHPFKSNEACYTQTSTTIGDDGTASFYWGCPIGYTSVWEKTYRPFDVGECRWPTTLATASYDVVASIVACCPDGDYSFTYSELRTTTTSHDDKLYYVNMYPMPSCHARNVKALSGKEVQFILTGKNRVTDTRDFREETQSRGTTTRLWDYEEGLLFAEWATFDVTVFHGTYSCMENCHKYFTSSYNNTDPNYTPTSTKSTTATTTSGCGGGDATQDSQGKATQGSAASRTMANTLFGKRRGIAALFVTLLLILH